MSKLIIFICAIILLTTGLSLAAGDDYIKNVELVEATIDIDHDHFPVAAYLCVTLKNNGGQKVANLNLEIKYYDAENYVMQKAIVKNGLNEPVKQGETKKYKIRLKGDIVNIDRAQYPYERSNEVAAFTVNIINVKLAR